MHSNYNLYSVMVLREISINELLHEHIYLSDVAFMHKYLPCNLLPPQNSSPNPDEYGIVDVPIPSLTGLIIVGCAGCGSPAASMAPAVVPSRGECCASQRRRRLAGRTCCSGCSARPRTVNGQVRVEGTRFDAVVEIL